MKISCEFSGVRTSSLGLAISRLLHRVGSTEEDVVRSEVSGRMTEAVPRPE
jgi:hypothetical protein